MFSVAAQATILTEITVNSKNFDKTTKKKGRRLVLDDLRLYVLRVMLSDSVTILHLRG